MIGGARKTIETSRATAMTFGLIPGPAAVPPPVRYDRCIQRTSHKPSDARRWGSTRLDCATAASRRRGCNLIPEFRPTKRSGRVRTNAMRRKPESWLVAEGATARWQR